MKNCKKYKKIHLVVLILVVWSYGNSLIHQTENIKEYD